MRSTLRLLAPLLLLLPASLHAETRLVPCRLPADARLLFTFEQHGWTRDGTPWRISLARALHLARDGLGYRLVVDPAKANGQLDEAAARRLAAVYDPNGQQVMTVRIDAAGQINGVDGLADLWRSHLARIERLVASTSADGGGTQRGRAALASLSSADDATKIRLLAGDVVGPLLRLCGQSVAAEPSAPGELAVKEEKDGEALHESAQYRVDAESGLMRSIERRLTLKAQPDRSQLTRWRFEPQS